MKTGSEPPRGEVATVDRPQPGAPGNQRHGHKLQNRSTSRTPQAALGVEAAPKEWKGAK